MAASQNSIQGSLFGQNEQSNTNKDEQSNNLKTSNKNLSNLELQEDASLRPRIKNTSKNLNQIINLDNLSDSQNDFEEPKWSHHNLPKIDDLTPALRHYVELKIDNPERILLYRLGDFF